MIKFVQRKRLPEAISGLLTKAWFWLWDRNSFKQLKQLSHDANLKKLRETLTGPKRQWDHVISIIVKPIIRDLQVRHKSSVATGCAGCGKPGGSIKEVTKALRTAHNIYSFALPRRTWDVWSCEKKPEEKLSSAKRTHGATGIADCFFSFFFLFVADFLQFAPQAKLVKKALS